jgi:putative oxidoreductase
MDRALLQRWAPRMLSILRMVAGFLFMPNGTLKLFNYPRPPHPMSHLPPLMLVAGILECFGGLLPLLGVFTRPVAFILSGEMAIAYFMESAPRGFWPILNNVSTKRARELNPGEQLESLFGDHLHGCISQLFMT